MYNSKEAILLAMALFTGPSSAIFNTEYPSTITKDPTCIQSLAAFSDAPVPDAALLSYFGSGSGTGPITAPGESTLLPDFTLDDPAGYQAVFCSLAQGLPASLKPDYQEYAQALRTYGQDHISAYYAYVTDCVATGDEASTILSQLSTMLLGTGNPCATTANTATPTGAYATGTGSFTVHPTGTGSPIPTAAAVAARPTGVVAGAAALGGLLGAVAML
ncbi:hypothetical protein F5Y08DRAFT_348509 [Xylaria arbuscula]|nr:hypothetical protein F5Y08DRAFT_348509 [Xylaria arbuscula]